MHQFSLEDVDVATPSQPPPATVLQILRDGARPCPIRTTHTCSTSRTIQTYHDMIDSFPTARYSNRRSAMAQGISPNISPGNERRSVAACQGTWKDNLQRLQWPGTRPSLRLIALLASSPSGARSSVDLDGADVDYLVPSAASVRSACTSHRPWTFIFLHRNSVLRHNQRTCCFRG